MLATAELAVNLNINFSVLLLKIVRKSADNEKKKGCQLALNMLKEAVDILLALGPTQMQDYESKLMVCYQNMAVFCRIIDDKKGLARVQAGIDKLDMVSAEADTQLDYWVSKVNHAHYNQKYAEMLAACQKADEVVEKCIVIIPVSIR